MKVCKKYGCKIKVREEGEEYCKLHRIDKKTNKYHASKQTYNGYNYDSILEARYAQKLDLLIKAKEVKSWERQHKIEIRVNDVHICNYYIDFKVYMPDGSIEYHEVKGAETMLWRMKWKLSKAIYPDRKFVLIKKV